MEGGRTGNRGRQGPPHEGEEDRRHGALLREKGGGGADGEGRRAGDLLPGPVEDAPGREGVLLRPAEGQDSVHEDPAVLGREVGRFFLSNWYFIDRIFNYESNPCGLRLCIPEFK